MEEDAKDDTPQPRKRSLWWHLWHVLRTVSLIALLPVIFFVAFAVLTVNQDIDAPEWLTSKIETRAGEALRGGSLEFGNIYINIGRDLHPRVRLVDTVVRDANGSLLARVSQVSGVISPRGVFFEGAVLMQNIELSGAQINLARAADGTVSLAFGGESSAKSASTFTELLDQSDQIFEQPALAALETVSATGVVINYADARAKRSWTVDGGLIDLDLRDEMTVLRGDFNVLSGGTELMRLTVNYESPRGSRASVMSAAVTNARARDIATQSPALQFLAEIDAPITAALRTSLDSAGKIGPLSATLELGQGALQPNAATAPISFDEAKAYLTYEPDSQLIKFDHVEWTSEQATVTATGRAYLRDLEDGVPQALVAQFSAPNARLAVSTFYPEGLDLPPVTIDARLRFRPFSIEVGQLALVDGDTHLAVSGKFSATDAGWDVAINGDVDQIAPERLVALWPATVKPKTRAWLADNVTGGRLLDTTFSVRAAAGTAPIVAARYEFADASLRFLRIMPLLERAAGVGFLQDHQMIVSLDRGVVSAPQGGLVNAAGTSFVILDTRIKGGDGQVSLALDGSITALMSLLDVEPLRLISKAGQSVTLADGRGSVSGSLQFPLRKGVPPNQIKFDVGAILRDVRSETLIKDRDLRASRLALAADNAGLQISGPVTLDGIAANGSWNQRFGAAGRGRSQVVADMALSQATLDTFKIALPPNTVSGAGRADITIDLVRGQAPAFKLTSALRGIGVAIPAIGWRKAQNAQGALTVEGSLGPIPRVDLLELSGGGLSAKGEIILNDQAALDQARFSQVRIGNWLNAPVILRGRGKGQPVGVLIGGGTIDLRGASFGANGGEAGPMSLSLDRLQITEGISLTDFSGDFTERGGFAGEFTGLLNGGPAVRGTVAPQRGRSAIRVRSDDAGGVAAAAGLIKSATSGTLDLTLMPASGAGSFDGDVTIRGLRIGDAPTMAALLDAISVAGLLRQLDGQGLAFDEVDAKFRLTPSQVILTQASAVGPGLGISLDGIYTLASKQIDFQGVISPLYLLNGIGSFLTRKGEGLIGFNFNLTGSAASPSVSVNPLSAFTPGMFREIFRRPVPEVTE